MSLLREQLRDRLAEVPPGVLEDVSPRDNMFHSPTGADYYFRLGWHALHCIKLAMGVIGKSWAARILDLPCGHGRVLRWLRAEFPNAALSACDTSHDGVDFCARAFGAIPLYSAEQPSDVRIEGEFDLIWCGSLLTHLDAEKWSGFLDLFESLLEPEGLLVVTTHGRSMVQRLHDPDQRVRMGLTEDEKHELLSSYERTGFAFSPYKLTQDRLRQLELPATNGISFSRPSWVCSQLETRPHLRMVSFVEGQWGAQDVVACIKVTTPANKFGTKFSSACP